MELPEIVHEDEVLLAINQPPARLVPGKNRVLTTPEALQMLRERSGGELFPVHRLDPEASGCALFAKTKVALDFFSGQFQAKAAQTTFFALVQSLVLVPGKVSASVRTEHGDIPAEFSIDAPLLPDPVEPGRFRLAGRGRGKDALSRFVVLERFGNFLWLSGRPETARPHQLRVHLAAAGLPIVGDELYAAAAPALRLSDLKRDFKGTGEDKPMVSHLALHAADITLRHPSQTEPLRVVAPLPTDLEVALRNLRKFSRGRTFRKPSFPT